MGTGTGNKLPAAGKHISIRLQRWSVLSAGDAWRSNRQEGGIILSAQGAQQKETENSYSVGSIYSLKWRLRK